MSGEFVPTSQPSEAMLEAGARALYRALPEAFSWRSSALLDLASVVYLAMDSERFPEASSRVPCPSRTGEAPQCAPDTR